MSNAPDPMDVLAFIDGYTNMPSEQWKARFPDWCELMAKARARYELETDYGHQGWACSDPMVSSKDCAIHHWVFLPLIQAALAAKDAA